jgi:hypothetical protein
MTTASEARAQTMYKGAYMATYNAMYMALYMVLRADVHVRHVGYGNRSIIGHHNTLVAAGVSSDLRIRNLAFESVTAHFWNRNLAFLGSDACRNLATVSVTSQPFSRGIRTYGNSARLRARFCLCLTRVRARTCARAGTKNGAHESSGKIISRNLVTSHSKAPTWK